MDCGLVWSRFDSVETIQVVLDTALLMPPTDPAQKRRVSRSALVREALREHLKRLAALEREQRDGEGFLRHPAEGVEISACDAAWPGE
jgi:metal-responsive CopG/Arc/MetJ family transcriptional regulator